MEHDHKLCKKVGKWALILFIAHYAIHAVIFLFNPILGFISFGVF